MQTPENEGAPESDAPIDAAADAASNGGGGVDTPQPARPSAEEIAHVREILGQLRELDAELRVTGSSVADVLRTFARQVVGKF